MVGWQFPEPHLTALYDPPCGRENRADFRFYLPLVMSANAVLDGGCGTGALLHWARESGHYGCRPVSHEPAYGMLAVACACCDIEWIMGGDLSWAAWDREFDLAVMTGQAFQVLIDDDKIRASLAGGGRFAFETRNPLAGELGVVDP